RITISGCQILNGFPDGLYLEDTRDVTVTGCTLTETREDGEIGVMVRWTGSGEGNLLSGNRIGKGKAGAVEIGDEAGVRCEGNFVDGE
ncbi:MAG: right-handed parallel beta-helix repeat-containing protein, partial [Candidatus Latescibacteria bacterium]|nr:right-handed parallel beta-helix repeat-containing protein [Candidatus Latescibacterota bacterium]